MTTPKLHSRYFLRQTDKWGGATWLTKELNEGGVLSKAVQHGCSVDVVERVLEAKADPNFRMATRVNNMESPLCYAAAHGMTAVVRMLLVHKADPDFCYEVAPVRWAVRTANNGMLQLLLRGRADVLRCEKTLMADADTNHFRVLIAEACKGERRRRGEYVGDDD